MGSTKIMKVALFAAVALLILVVPNFAATFTCNVYALGMNAGQKTCDAGSRCYQSLLPDSQGGAPLIVSGRDNYQKDGKTAYMCTDFGLSSGQCCTMPNTNQKVNCLANNMPSSAPTASNFTACSSTCTKKSTATTGGVSCNTYALGMNAGAKQCDTGSRCYQSLLPDSSGGAPLIVSGCDKYQKDGKTAYMCTDYGLSPGQCCTMPITNQKVNCIADNEPSSAPQ